MRNFNQEEFNKFIVENGVYGFFEEPITLKSGRESHFYANWRNVVEDVYLTDKLADFVIDFAQDFLPLSEGEIKRGCDTFYGVPEGATKLGVITQYKWAMQSPEYSQGSHTLGMGRAKPKDHGEAKDKYFVGMPKGRVVVLEDVTTTGGSMLNTLDSLKEAGVNVVAVISLTNRMEKRDDGLSVEEAVKQKGVKFYSMSSALEMLPMVYEKLQPGEEIGRKVEEYYDRYGVEKLRIIPSKIFKKGSNELNDLGKEARSKVCLALDNNIEATEELRNKIEELSLVAGMFKIGMESFTKFGLEAIKIIQEFGSEVFLDLKYYDIPNTVKGAAYAATKQGVSIFNVHASGGIEMMKAVIDGAKEASEKYLVPMPKIIGVTILTSIDKEIMNEEQRIEGDVEDQVLHLAKLAEQSGLDGIVCSAGDLKKLKKEFSDDFLFVTPGIRLADSDNQDQKRVVAPGDAIGNGASILVIGRTVTGRSTKEERLEAGYRILEEIAEKVSNSD